MQVLEMRDTRKCLNTAAKLLKDKFKYGLTPHTCALPVHLLLMSHFLTLKVLHLSSAGSR